MNGVPCESEALAPPATALTDVTVIEHLWHTHTCMHEYIRFADAKAGVVVFLASGMVAAMYAARLHIPLLKSGLSSWGYGDLSAAMGFICLALGIWSAIWTVKPRLSKRQSSCLIFWDSIRRFEGPTEFWDAISRQTSTTLSEHLAGNLHTLAKVCHRKYCWVSIGIWFSMIGAIAGALALFLKTASAAA